MDIKKYKILIFDCDGVIFDTTHLKLKAFKEAISGFDDVHIEAFDKYFRSNFGKSRYAHAQYFIEKILDQPFDQELYDSIINDYGKRCISLYENAATCAGVLELLERLGDITKYIASGSDQLELREVFKTRNIDHFFSSVFGSPRQKSDLVYDICSRHQFERTLMIGDAHADYEAAKSSNIDFLFIERYSTDRSKMNDLASKGQFLSIWDLSYLY